MNQFLIMAKALGLDVTAGAWTWQNPQEFKAPATEKLWRAYIDAHPMPKRPPPMPPKVYLDRAAAGRDVTTLGFQQGYIQALADLPDPDEFAWLGDWLKTALPHFKYSPPPCAPTILWRVVEARHNGGEELIGPAMGADDAADLRNWCATWSVNKDARTYRVRQSNYALTIGGGA